MEYIRYGIVFERLSIKHIEQVRSWRNQEYIKNVMQYRENIQPDDQIKWFNSLNHRNDWYFVVRFADSLLGLFHIKDIDWIEKTGEAGGFISDRKFMGNLNTGLTILALMDFAFMVLDLQTLVATYHPEISAIALLNRQLGYSVFEELPTGFVKACVDKKRFYGHAATFLAAAKRLRGKEIFFTEIDDFLQKKLADGRFSAGF